MADNTAQSANENIATDDIGGVKYQRVKLTLGADGENGGDASSDNPVPVGAAILESLVDTLQELIQRLTPLGSAMNIAGGVGLRVVGVGGTMTASGPLTSAQYTASNLTSRLAVENQTAVLANINNCTGA